MNWVAEIQTTVYSRLKGILLSELADKYEDILITEEDSSLTDARFPTVYVTFIGASERGQTLDGTNINAVDLSAEVHVKVTNEQGIAVNREVAWEVVEAFKTMGFTATMPNIATSNYDGVYESVSRYSRIIGQGDVI